MNSPNGALSSLHRAQHDKGKRHRGFADFFPLHAAEFQKRVPIITMEEFLKREGGADGRLPIPEANRDVVLNAASHCEKREKSESLFSYMSFLPSFLGRSMCALLSSIRR